MQETYVDLISDHLMFDRDIPISAMSLFSSINCSLNKNGADELHAFLNPVNQGHLSLTSNKKQKNTGILIHLLAYTKNSAVNLLLLPKDCRDEDIQVSIKMYSWVRKIFKHPTQLINKYFMGIAQ